MGNLQDRIEEIIRKGDAVSSNEVEAARKALKQAINSIASEICILRREKWTYERTCVALPPSLNDESIDVRIDVLLEGTLDLLVDSDKIKRLNSFDADSISRLITALGNASVKELRMALLDDDDGETTENDISTEEISREITIVPSSRFSDIRVSETHVFLKEEESRSFEIDVILCEVDVNDDLDGLTGNIFCVGCPFTDSEEAEDTLANSDALGEFEPLWRWIPSKVNADIGDVGWAEWFTSKVCQVI